MWYIDNQRSLLAEVSLSCCRGHYEIVRIASSLSFTLLSPPLPSVCHVSSQALVNFDKTLIKSFFCQQYNVKDMQPTSSQVLVKSDLNFVDNWSWREGTQCSDWCLESGPIRGLHFQFWTNQMAPFSVLDLRKPQFGVPQGVDMELARVTSVSSTVTCEIVVGFQSRVVCHGFTNIRKHLSKLVTCENLWKDQEKASGFEDQARAWRKFHFTRREDTVRALKKVPNLSEKC